MPSSWAIHVLGEEGHFGSGFPEAGPEKRIWVPVVYFGSDTRNIWKGNGEVKKGRKLAKKPLLSKQILTVGNWSLTLLGDSQSLQDTCTSVFLPWGGGPRACAHRVPWSLLEDLSREQ